MKSQKTSLIGPLIQFFFTQHLLINKRVSPQTVTSYRDTLKLFLQYLKEQTGKEPVVLQVSDLDVPAVLSFLDHLEQARHNSARSRNVRLAAIRTLFRWIALQDPENAGLATRVLSIPCKRTDKRMVRALSRTEIEAILAAPDLTRWSGRRDHALLLTLYNTGARVSEIAELKRSQANLRASSFLQLHGKVMQTLDNDPAARSRISLEQMLSWRRTPLVAARWGSAMEASFRATETRASSGLVLFEIKRWK